MHLKCTAYLFTVMSLLSTVYQKGFILVLHSNLNIKCIWWCFKIKKFLKKKYIDNMQSIHLFCRHVQTLLSLGSTWKLTLFHNLLYDPACSVVWLATCVNVEQVGLLLLPSLDAIVLLGECSDVCAHALHHHAVDSGMMLCTASPHRPGAQLGHTAAGRALLTSLFWKEDGHTKK